MSEELTRFVESYSSDSMYIKKAEPVREGQALQGIYAFQCCQYSISFGLRIKQLFSCSSSAELQVQSAS